MQEISIANKLKLSSRRYAGASRGEMGNWVTVTKIVSPEAKNMFGWIEWIVMADLPLKIVKNEYYKKDQI